MDWEQKNSLHKVDYDLKPLSKELAIDFIQTHHYSPMMPKLTKHYLGCFLDGELVGVLTLGWGTQPRQTINKMFTGLESKHYWEIGKMCMTDEMPTNSESQMIKKAVRWIKDNCPDVLFLYTMADGIMGKCGYVYQASNFLYGGTFYTQVYEINGEKVHPRATRKLCEENAKFSGKERVFWLTSDFMQEKGIKKIEGYMFRYIFPLNKKAKKLLKKSNMEWTRTYPKDHDLKWFDKTSKPKFEIEQPHFTYEEVLHNARNISGGGASLRGIL